MDRVFAASCDPVRAGVALVSRERRWVMYDREPLGNWTTGRITLLGDAAHPMVQYLAQGAGQAIEDAGCLARQLTRYDGDAVRAFAAYQAERIPRTARIQRSARIWGQIWHDDGPVIPLLRDHHDRRFDQEGELALVIGRTARRVSEQEALSHVFGYTGLLDITMRGGEDRSVRKSFETFTPMGPVLVTADEFGDPGRVELRCWVSGELRQQASTRDLIWDVARLVAYASSVTTLYPGDVISTGTPAGVGPLAAGDTIRLELSGLGLDLTARVAAADALTGQGGVRPGLCPRCARR